MQQAVIMQITVLVLMGAGFVLQRCGIVSDAGKQDLMSMVINVTLPASIVKAFSMDVGEDMLRAAVLVLIASALVQGLGVVVGRTLLFTRNRAHQINMEYGLLNNNAGFIGNPVAESIFGPQGLVLAAIYQIPQRIVMWSYGLTLYVGKGMNRRQILKKVLLHPCILACMLGTLLMLFRLRLPEVLAKPLNAVGSCNTGLSVMLVGMSFDRVHLRALFTGEVLYYCFLRLILMPLAVYIPLRAAGIANPAAGVIVLLTAMPAGAISGIMASKYHCDEDFSTAVIMLSTVISMVTLPVWTALLV